jgi:ABC-type multidrug transport system fused ATPase/permease subunit
MFISNLVISNLSQIFGSINSYKQDNLKRKFYHMLGDKVMSVDFRHLESPNFLNLFQRIQQNVDVLLNTKWAIMSITSGVLTLAGLTFIISFLNPVILLLIIIIVCINTYLNSKTVKYNYQWQKDMAPFNRKGNYIIALMLGFDNGKEIRINNLKEWIGEKFETIRVGYMSEFKKVVYKYLKINLLSITSTIVQDALIYSYLAYRVISKPSITIGQFTMYLTAIGNFSSALNNITSQFVSLSQNSLYVDKFKEFMDLKSDNEKFENKVLSDIKENNYIFEFKNVSFKYPGSEKYALKNINIVIDFSQKLSIVGMNGSGKTTFIKLLTRLYEPTEGQILLNGVDIKTITYKEYVKLFAVVFQDFKLFAFSMEENIVLNGEKDETKVLEAIKKSGLQNKLDKLPKGTQTSIFKIFDEHGIEFSGGESQKLVIARALYKNSPIIVLDEPTAALDPLAEYEIYKSFDELVKNKTAIYVSHRLSSSRFCDKVAVFHNGEIIEYGTHHQLIKLNGLYSDMYKKQAQFYVEAEAEVAAF